VHTFERQVGPQRIVFGAGTTARVGQEVARLGGTRVLVLSTPEQADLAQRVATLVGAVGTFSRAAMHTPLDVTQEALARAEELRVDAVVSVGGGSTTGLGKAVASRSGLAHLVLPTTYAGSEVTPVLGETADGEKVTRSAPEILPDAVVYDVDLTLTLPWAMTLTSAVNSMAHAVEALYAVDRTAETDARASEAIGDLAGGLRALHAESDEHDGAGGPEGEGAREARADLLHGAWLAGTCLGTVGMGLHHKLCHVLGGSFGLPHAPTHTVVLPHAMAHNADAAPEAMAAVTRALGTDDPAPRAVQRLVAGLGGPTDLAGLGFAEPDVPRAAELATARPYPNPREVTRDGVAALLLHATRGDDL